MRLPLRVDESLNATELTNLAKRESDARVRGRITAIRYLRLGHTVPEASRALGFDEPALVRSLGMEYVAIPVGPRTFGPDDADRLKDVLRRTPGPVLIHCASSNRAGAVWALCLNRHRGIGVEDAIELGREAGLQSTVLAEMVKSSAK